MRWTLKDCLKNCCMALRKMSGKRDKWVKDWPGQVSDLNRVRLGKCMLARVVKIYFFHADADNSQPDPVDHRCHQISGCRQRECRQISTKIHEEETGEISVSHGGLPANRLIDFL